MKHALNVRGSSFIRSTCWHDMLSPSPVTSASVLTQISEPRPPPRNSGAILPLLIITLMRLSWETCQGQRRDLPAHSEIQILAHFGRTVCNCEQRCLRWAQNHENHSNVPPFTQDWATVSSMSISSLYTFRWPLAERSRCFHQANIISLPAPVNKHIKNSHLIDLHHVAPIFRSLFLLLGSSAEALLSNSL